MAIGTVWETDSWGADDIWEVGSWAEAEEADDPDHWNAMTAMTGNSGGGDITED